MYIYTTLYITHIYIIYIYIYYIYINSQGPSHIFYSPQVLQHNKTVPITNTSDDKYDEYDISFLYVSYMIIFDGR